MSRARHHDHTTVHGQRLERHYPGCWRFTLPGGRFAQIKRGRHYSSVGGLQDRFVSDVEGRHYVVEIRRSVNGDLVRYAGVHSSLRAAVEEVL